MCVCRRYTGTPRWAASATACRGHAVYGLAGTSCRSSARPATASETATTPPPRWHSTVKARALSSATVSSSDRPETTSSTSSGRVVSVTRTLRPDQQAHEADCVISSRRGRTAAISCAAGEDSRLLDDKWLSAADVSSTGVAASSVSCVRERSRSTCASRASTTAW